MQLINIEGAHDVAVLRDLPLQSSPVQTCFSLLYVANDQNQGDTTMVLMATDNGGKRLLGTFLSMNILVGKDNRNTQSIVSLSYAFPFLCCTSWIAKLSKLMGKSQGGLR